MTRAIALAVLLIGACSGGSEPADPARPRRAEAPRPDVAQRLTDAIRALEPGAEVERRGPDRIAVGEREIDLRNLGEECRRDPDVCESAIQRWARTAIAGDASPTRAAIRAVLLPIEAVEVARAQAQAQEPTQGEGGAQPLVGRTFVGPLYESFVIDEPDRIVHLSTSHLEALGHPSLDELHELALTNMRAAFPAILSHEPFADQAPDVRVVRIGDSYENSRLLLHERWAPIARSVRGDLLAAAQARDVVIFTGSESARDVAALRWLAQEMTQNEPHPIAPAILRWTAERWELFHPNDRPDPAIADALRAPR